MAGNFAVDKNQKPLSSQEKVLRILECPVCLDLAVSPIHMCRAGHFVCGVCRNKVRLCSICNKEFSEARNYALEGLMSFLEIKCKNKLCMEMIKVSKLEEHLSICEFRPIACNDSYKTVCQGKLVNLEKYTEHLVKFHEAELSIYRPRECLNSYYSLSSENIEQGSTTWEPQPFIEGDVTFVLHLELRAAILYVWVSALLSEAQASEYLAELKFGEEQTHCISLTKFSKWSIGIGSIHRPFVKVQNSKDCAAIPLRTLLAYSSKQNFGNYSFSVETKIIKTEYNHNLPVNN